MTIDNLKNILNGDGGHSLVIENDGITTFDGRGISDLFRLLHENPIILNGAVVADKIVGKAAAALMIIGKVKEVYADIISEPALALLENSAITVNYGLKVNHIINRTNTGWCPMEILCKDSLTADDCYNLISNRLNSK